MQSPREAAESWAEILAAPAEQRQERVAPIERTQERVAPIEAGQERVAPIEHRTY
jgi:hypothetical protein